MTRLAPKSRIGILRDQQWPALLTVLTVATGMAYSFWWAPVVRHRRYYWVIPGDIWSTFRVAHYVGWGDLSFTYSANTGLVTLPGYEVLLSPIAALSSRLGLVESSPVVFLPRPSTWFLLGPFILLTAIVPLVALDRLAHYFHSRNSRRSLLLIGEAVVLWPVTAIWGHPEDVLALGLLMFCLVAVLNGRMTRAGWLLGAAVSMQLLVILVVPIMIAVACRRRAVPLLLRASVFPGFLLVAVLIPNFHDSWHALTNQPNYPTVDHPTPWVLVSPQIAPHVVAAGPGRIVGLAMALGCGVAALRYRRDFRWILWLAAVAMTGRCLFEAVVDPYYVAPAVSLALVVAFTNNAPRAAVATLWGGIATVITYWHANMWVWWFEMTVPLLLMLWASCPSRNPTPPTESELSAPCELGMDDSVPAIVNG